MREWFRPWRFLLRRSQRTKPVKTELVGGLRCQKEGSCRKHKDRVIQGRVNAKHERHRGSECECQHPGEQCCYPGEEAEDEEEPQSGFRDRDHDSEQRNPRERAPRIECRGVEQEVVKVTPGDQGVTGRAPQPESIGNRGEKAGSQCDAKESRGPWRGRSAHDTAY